MKFSKMLNRVKDLDVVRTSFHPRSVKLPP